MNLVRKVLAIGLAAGMMAPQLLAAPLSGDARAAIPSDVQQLIVIDYRAMQNSQVAMQLKGRVMPPELKQLEQALRKSGLNDNHDVDVLAFASFRTKGGGPRMIGIAQGQFQMHEFLVGLKKKGIKPTLVRTNKTYPMGDTGMRICFLNSSAFVFGGADAVKLALDARDGVINSMLSNQAVTDLIGPVQNDAFWSVLDAKGTQYMMRSLLSEAPQVTDYEVVKKTLEGSRYSMNFTNGVEFNLDVITPDRFSATTLSALLNAALLYKKTTGNDTEKAAMAATTVSSDSGTLKLRYEASDNQFASLLNSQLFQSVVR